MESPLIHKQGTAVGNFTSTWSQQPIANPFENGRAELTVTLDGQLQKFTRVGITATQERGRNPTFNILGLRESDGKLLVISLGVESEKLAANSSLPIDMYSIKGWLVEVIPGTDSSKLMGGLFGEFHFREVSTKEGAKVSGNFVADIYR